MKNIDEITKKIDTLTPIPQITNRVMEIAEDPDGSLSDLADVIQHDAAITANLLKICNSAYFSLPGHVNSVHQAVSLLGLNQVVELILIKNVGGNLLNGQKGYSLEKGELWKHSVATALVSKTLAENKKASDKYLVYTAALLKDIGKVIIESYVGRSIVKINYLAYVMGYSFEQAEEKVLGTNHAALGGLIAEKWNFSPKMIFIIKNHHLADLKAREDFETSIVYLAETVSMMDEIGIGADGLAYKMYEEIFDNLAVSKDYIQQLMTEYRVGLWKAERLLNVI